ncbi:F-box protein At4g05010-like [Oryza glaberrima]|uniref:F-box domain-containing protein n=1 Tax=Oryza glaberrima TaxID=4538 RepID=I1QBL3_ORYGL|nr:F-box protein At4g05010-like [Oryza glaberrima]
MAIGQAKTKSSLSTSLSFSCSSTRILGRKRVAVSPAPPPSGGPHSPVRTLRKQRSTRLHMDDAVSLLESLPQDVLIKVLCKVNHSDLRALLLVSKQVSEATVVAREQHFAFATPSSKAALRGGEEEEEEAPGAPKLQRRVARSSPVWGKNLASISVNLFEAFESEVVEM